MANLTVIIDCDEQGNYSVGQEPHESDAQESAEQSGQGGDDDSGIQMQPAKSLDDALKQARALFMQADQASGGAGSGQADQAMSEGYQSVAQGSGGSGMM